MKNKKKIIIPIVALTVIAGVATYGMSKANADEKGFKNMSQEITERFNLNQEEVNTFFSEKREQREEENKIRREENLNQAVLDGKITEEQKDALIAKREEMRVSREDLKNLSQEERRKKRKEHRDEIQIWAQENGIHLSDLRSEGGQDRNGIRRGFRK